MRTTCLALMAAIGMLGQGAKAHDGVPHRVVAPGGPVDVAALAPGANGRYAFRVEALGTAGTAFAHAVLDSRPEALAQYAFVADDAACGAPAVEFDPYGRPLLFFPVQMPPTGAVDCGYTVTRAVGSVDDLGFAFPNACNFRPCTVRRGSFTDQAVRIEAAPQPDDGVDRMTYRLVLDDLGGRAVEGRVVTTECAEFGSGQFHPMPFVIESGFPGACPTSDYGEVCFNFTGQAFDSRAFLLGPTSAGDHAGCLVRLRYPGGRVVPASLAMYFVDDRVPLADGAVAFDRVGGNDAAVLGAAGPVHRTTIPVPPTAALLIALVCLLTAARYWRPPA